MLAALAVVGLLISPLCVSASFKCVSDVDHDSVPGLDSAAIK